MTRRERREPAAADAAGPPISPHHEGVVLTVKVVPRAGRTAIAGVRGQALLVRLAAPPVDGAANEALAGLLAETFGGPKRGISLVSGHRSREKRVLLRGVDVHAVRRRLAELL